MSNVELGDYLIAILDINNGSLKAVNSPPSKWMFVGMTQHRPSSFEGSDAGKCEFCPLKILMQVERLAKPSHSTSRPSWDKTTRISRTAWEYQKSWTRSRTEAGNIVTLINTRTALSSTDPWRCLPKAHKKETENYSSGTSVIGDRLLDSGCTIHMTPHIDDFVRELVSHQSMVETANGGLVEVTMNSPSSLAKMKGTERKENPKPPWDT
jgi:hypothetical protein